MEMYLQTLRLQITSVYSREFIISFPFSQFAFVEVNQVCVTPFRPLSFTLCPKIFKKSELITSPWTAATYVLWILHRLLCQVKISLFPLHNSADFCHPHFSFSSSFSNLVINALFVTLSLVLFYLFSSQFLYLVIIPLQVKQRPL